MARKIKGDVEVARDLTVGRNVGITGNLKVGDTIISGEGTRNTRVGEGAGSNTTTAAYLTAVGAGAGEQVTEGTHNTFLGSLSGSDVTTGNYNVSVGADSLQYNVTGEYNTALGATALRNAAGSRNTAVGRGALYGTSGSTGSGNVAVGYQAGYNETGSDKLHIANNSGESLIEGDFAAKTLTINGALDVTGGFQTDNTSFVSDVRSYYNASTTDVEWITIAHTNSGDHGMAIISLFGYNGSEHVGAKFLVSNSHGYSAITQLSGVAYGGSGTAGEVESVRTMYLTSDKVYGGCRFQVEVQPEESIRWTVESYTQNNTFQGWVSTAPLADDANWTVDHTLENIGNRGLQSTKPVQFSDDTFIGGDLTLSGVATLNDKVIIRESEDYPLQIGTGDTNAGLIGIQFQGNNAGQVGYMNANHLDSESDGANYSFRFLADDGGTALNSAFILEGPSAQTKYRVRRGGTYYDVYDEGNKQPWTVTAGNGLTGGGTSNSSLGLNVGAGAGISVAANTVDLDVDKLTSVSTPQSNDHIIINTSSGPRKMTVANFAANSAGGQQLVGRATPVANTNRLTTDNADNATITANTAPNASGGDVSVDGYTFVCSVDMTANPNGVTSTITGASSQIHNQDQLVWVGAQSRWIQLEVGNTVTSVFGRTGAITAEAGDYTAAQVGALPIGGGTITGKLNVNGGIELTSTTGLYTDRSPNFDGIWFDESNNAWNMLADGTNERDTGNARVNAGRLVLSDYNNGDNSIHISRVHTDANNSDYGIYLNYDISGDQATTADRGMYGMHIDMDSSATGGNTSDEHRLYGYYASVKATGDSDVIVGAHGRAEAEHSSGAVTTLFGTYGYALFDGRGGTASSVKGAQNYAAMASSATSNTSYIYGSYNKALMNGSGGGTVSTRMVGVHAEVELDAGSLNEARAIQAIVDRDAGTINNGYLFWGAYEGTKPTNAWGIYMTNADKHQLSGTTTLETLSTTSTSSFAGRVTISAGGAGIADSWGLDMNNGQIRGMNAMYFNDESQAVDEGLMFPRSGATSASTIKADYYGLRITGAGQLTYFDGPGGETDRKVYHSGDKPTASEIGALASSGGTVSGNLTVDNGNSTVLQVLGNNSGIAEVKAMGSDQGTGRFYAGQSNRHGGGFYYNGDDTPDLPGGSDEIAFFRRDASTDHLVFSYRYNNNNVTFTGNVTANSDIRLKENFEPIQNALEKVESIGGYTYNRIDEGCEGERHAGVIAQEIEKVLPEVVDSSGEYKSVAYGNLTALLIEAVKELSAKVKELEEK